MEESFWPRVAGRGHARTELHAPADAQEGLQLRQESGKVRAPGAPGTRDSRRRAHTPSRPARRSQLCRPGRQECQTLRGPAPCRRPRNPELRRCRGFHPGGPKHPSRRALAALTAVVSMLDRPVLTLLIEALALSASTWMTSWRVLSAGVGVGYQLDEFWRRLRGWTAALLISLRGRAPVSS